jgi:hypothetical protein
VEARRDPAQPTPDWRFPSQWIELDTGTVKAFAGVIQTAVAVNP